MPMTRRNSESPKMPTTRPYNKFQRTQNRCSMLVKLYEELHRKKLTSNRDLARSSVVLAVASMDAYFTDKFCDLVVPVLKRGHRVGDGLANLLNDAGLDVRQALEMLAMERPYRRIRTLVTRHLELRVTQRLDAIDELFVCLGLKDFCAKVQARLHRKNLLKRVRTLVERRHKIVHYGDYNQHYRLRPIDVARTRRQLADLQLLVEEAERLLNEVFP